MKQFLMPKIAVLYLLSTFGCITAYPYGYSKLYNDSTNTVVDLLYDTHVPRYFSGNSDLRSMSYDGVKNQLYPTEAAVLNAFDTLNAYSSQPIDLLWESSPARPIYSAMLIACDWLVEGRYPRLSFKHSDTWRPDFSNLFFRNGVLKYGVTMNKPLPVYESVRSHIARQAGASLLNAYDSFSHRIENEVKNYFKPHYDKGVCADGEYSYFWQDNFLNNDTYHAIADAEMVSKILSSDKKRVILYAGGWHSGNISTFLKKNGYRVLHEKINAGYFELPLVDLQPLSQIHGPRGPQPSAAPHKPVVAPRVPQKPQPRKRGKPRRLPLESALHMHLGLSAALGEGQATLAR